MILFNDIDGCGNCGKHSLASISRHFFDTLDIDWSSDSVFDLGVVITIGKFALIDVFVVVVVVSFVIVLTRGCRVGNKLWIPLLELFPPPPVPPASVVRDVADERGPSISEIPESSRSKPVFGNNCCCCATGMNGGWIGGISLCSDNDDEESADDIRSNCWRSNEDLSGLRWWNNDVFLELTGVSTSWIVLNSCASFVATIFNLARRRDGGGGGWVIGCCCCFIEDVLWKEKN